MSKSFYTKHSGGVNVFHNGKTFQVSSTAPQYESLLAALRVGDWSKVAELSSLSSSVNKLLKESSRVKVKDGELVYTAPNKTTQVLQGPLIDRILTAFKEGQAAEAVSPLIKFMDNVMRNKHKDIRAELYEFLQSGAMPITEDGCFLAYKRVRDNFRDLHTGKMDNSPGRVVAMPEKEVDSNRNALCSTGLHFCSRSYLRSFGGPRTVIVKVNPRHVFAIPTDYENAKGRASEYFVVGECKSSPDENELFKHPFVYDRTKKAAAPGVKFTALKAGLLALAKGYKLVKGGKVAVRVADSKGELPLDKRSVVKKVGRDFISAITGKVVPSEHVRYMSATTKSVRSILVRAVARSRS